MHVLLLTLLGFSDTFHKYLPGASVLSMQASVSGLAIGASRHAGPPCSGRSTLCTLTSVLPRARCRVWGKQPCDRQPRALHLRGGSAVTRTLADSSPRMTVISFQG